MSIVSLPRRRPTGVRAGGASVKKKPTVTCSGSGFPVGWRCSWTTRSLPGSSRHGMPSGDGMRRLPGRPAEQLPFGIARVAHHAADVARLGIARDRAGATTACDRRRGSRGARRARCRDGTRSRARSAARVDRNRNHERAKHIGAVGPARCTARACGRRGRACRAASRRATSAAAADRRRSPSARRRRSIAATCRSSASVSRRSFWNSPFPASGFHGGMTRRAVTVAICVARRLTSS